jgi:hypothetical protein
MSELWFEAEHLTELIIAANAGSLHNLDRRNPKEA